LISAELQAQQLTTIPQMFLCPLANIVRIFRDVNKDKFQNPRPRTFMLFLRTRQGQGPGLTSLCIFLTISFSTLFSATYLFAQVECLRFLSIANKLTAPKLDAIDAVQAATIIFFSWHCYIRHLVERGQVYGRVYGSVNITLTTWQVSDLSPPVGSGPYSGIWYGPDLSETWSQYMSGRVRSGRVRSGLVRVRVVEFGLNSRWELTVSDLSKWVLSKCSIM